MGRGDGLREGDWNSMCWSCGRKRKAGDLMKYWQGFWICPEHWETRQPQDFARGVPDVQTPPWVQPMLDATFTGVTQITIVVTGSGPFIFTATEDITEDTFITLDTEDGPIGPFPLEEPIVEGEEVTLSLEAIAGTGNANGEGARYQWSAFNNNETGEITTSSRGFWISAPTVSGTPLYKVFFYDTTLEQLILIINSSSYHPLITRSDPISIPCARNGFKYKCNFLPCGEFLV